MRAQKKKKKNPIQLLCLSTAAPVRLAQMEKKIKNTKKKKSQKPDPASPALLPQGVFSRQVFSHAMTPSPGSAGCSVPVSITAQARMRHHDTRQPFGAF